MQSLSNSSKGAGASFLVLWIYTAVKLHCW